MVRQFCDQEVAFRSYRIATDEKSCSSHLDSGQEKAAMRGSPKIVSRKWTVKCACRCSSALF